MPGDVDNARTVFGVNRITVAVQNPTPTTPPAGAVTIEDGPFTRTLSASQLAALPSRTRNVSFLAGTASQSHTEVGQALAQPRLVVDLNVKGGRYVADVVDLVVGQGVAPHPGW